MVAAPPREPKRHPIFQLYTLDEIAEKTGYAIPSLLMFQQGHRAPTQKFRRMCSLAFRRPERDLFLEEEA